MDGVLIVNKEKGYTSFDAVARLRGIFGQKKIGHLGTLDPEAEGVLPVLLGRATKLADLLSEGSKVYRTVLYLGAETDTQDACGRVLEHHPVRCTEDEVREAVLSFAGKSSQLTPMYSARKVGGRKLVDLARKGIETERAESEIFIEELEILSIHLPRVTLRVRCSRGTYIRTLCHDIGRKLGCGGLMEELVREESSGFTLREAYPLGVIESMKLTGHLGEAVLPLESILKDYPVRRLKPAAEAAARNGNFLAKDSFEEAPKDGEGTLVRVTAPDGFLIGLFRREGGKYRPAVMLLPDPAPAKVREPAPSVVSIGKFDGMHVGHRKIFEEMRRQAEGSRLKEVLFAFNDNPMAKGEPRAMLLSSAEKKQMAKDLGMDRLVECPFTDAIRTMSADDFLEKILIGQLGMRSVVAGPDCSFGYKRGGNVEMLRDRAEKLGFALTVIPKEIRGGEVVSSTRIRDLIAEGRMEEAEECLGYPYFIRARIGYGEHVGTAIGIPTANQRVPDGKLCPPYGVYVSLLETEGRVMPAITNIGVKPTAGPGFHLGLETHVLDGGRELYGQMAETRLLHFLRPERKFSTMQELKEEVERNIAAAREFFAESREKQNHPE